MAEELVITDPIVPPTPPTTTKYKVISMQLNLEALSVVGATPPAAGLVLIQVRDNTGVLVNAQYNGDQALDLIKYLNTANFSTQSMQKRILNKLSADGMLPPGTVQGTPDPPADPPN